MRRRVWTFEKFRLPMDARRKSGIGLPHSMTSRTEQHARPSRQRRGVRQSYAAFLGFPQLKLSSVHQTHAAPSGGSDTPHVGGYADESVHRDSIATATTAADAAAAGSHFT